MKTIFPLAIVIVIGVNLIGSSIGSDPIAWNPTLLQLTDADLHDMYTAAEAHKYYLKSNEEQRLVQESFGEANLLFQQGKYFPKRTDYAKALLSVGRGNNGKTNIYTFIAFQLILKKSNFTPFDHVTVVIIRESVEDDEVKTTTKNAEQKKAKIDAAVKLLKDFMGEGNVHVIEQDISDTVDTILKKMKNNQKEENSALEGIIFYSDGGMGAGKEGSEIANKLHVALDLAAMFKKAHRHIEYGHDISSGVGGTRAGVEIKSSAVCNSIGRVHPKQRPQGVVITSSMQILLNAFIWSYKKSEATFGQVPVVGDEIKVVYVEVQAGQKEVLEPTENIQAFKDACNAYKVTFYKGYGVANGSITQGF